MNQTTRKCIVSGKILPVDELIRFDYKKDTNTISLDLDKTKKGRGCYLYLSEENWACVLKTKALNRAFRTNVTKETYAQIEKELKEAKCLKRID
ncbi:YlxR family protein [Mycoplasmopsis mucosicanis]|uniref:YlxR family protein n=1 Tax=Mycoplasmopsis mucosicanis TaxID=458208 RepID=A0A507SSD6_9BACT|nr:YlxR family protein [Mycoplasmopsis mucosicanis]TQC53996.1 YlxR family protein [Mycoplasmopsis mucosicanis]